MVWVEHYAKTNEQQWIFQEYKNPGDRINLSTFSLEFAVSDLYENIQFESI